MKNNFLKETTSKHKKCIIATDGQSIEKGEMTNWYKSSAEKLEGKPYNK
jgi:hypothetical protein